MENPTAPAPEAARRTLAVLSCLLLATVLGTVLAVDRLSVNRGLADVIMAWELERFERGESFFPNRGNFLEFEDRLLIEEIPGADYSRGGVYYFGSSDLKWSLKTWELPPEVRPYVGNYGLGAISHTFELQFIRHLVEEEGLLRAGGDRNLIVLGAAHTNVLEPDVIEGSYFPTLWERHGLYRYGREEGIRPVEMSAFRRFLRRRKARWSGFVAGNANRLARVTVEDLGFAISETFTLADKPELIKRKVRKMHHDWETDFPRQMEELRALVRYVRGRGAHLAVVLLPHRRYLDEIPALPQYRAAVTALCAGESIPLLDLSHLLEDDEFFDVSHPNARGLEKTHRRLMEVAWPHLRRIGVLPGDLHPD